MVTTGGWSDLKLAGSSGALPKKERKWLSAFPLGSTSRRNPKAKHVVIIHVSEAFNNEFKTWIKSPRETLRRIHKDVDIEYRTGFTRERIRRFTEAIHSHSGIFGYDTEAGGAVLQF